MMQLFKPLPDEKRRSVSILLRLTKTEAQKIKASAEICCLTVSDFIRRAALRRKTESHYETHTILALSALTQEIRAMHKTYTDLGFKPPEELWLPILQRATEAMLRISK